MPRVLRSSHLQLRGSTVGGQEVSEDVKRRHRSVFDGRQKTTSTLPGTHDPCLAADRPVQDVASLSPNPHHPTPLLFPLHHPSPAPLQSLLEDWHHLRHSIPHLGAHTHHLHSRARVGTENEETRNMRSTYIKRQEKKRRRRRRRRRRSRRRRGEIAHTIVIVFTARK